MESLLLSLLLAAAAASAILCGEVVEEPVCVGRPLLLPLGDHVRQRGGAVLRMGWDASCIDHTVITSNPFTE